MMRLRTWGILQKLSATLVRLAKIATFLFLAEMIPGEGEEVIRRFQDDFADRTIMANQTRTTPKRAARNPISLIRNMPH